MTLALKLEQSGLSYDDLLDTYRDVLSQTGSKKQAADHIFWRSEGWEGELFTLPELMESLEEED